MASKSNGMTRREFLSRGAMAAAGVAAASSLVIPRQKAMGNPIGANDTIVMAVIGIHGRGQSHIQNFAEMDKVRIKTLCDVDEKLFPDRVKATEDIQKSRPGTEWDLRKVYEDPDIDAVSIATPNHWHALATIWACQAGKHVYCEKPASHNIFEGRKMVEAARKHNRLVQIGFQNRSRQNTNAAIKFLRDGGIGEVYMARGLCFKPRGDIVNPSDQPVPEGLHYDLWLGPAQKRPFNPNYVHYNWHWHWAFGNGDTGNQGPHQFDIARWGLGKEEAPIKVSSMVDITSMIPPRKHRIPRPPSIPMRTGRFWSSPPVVCLPTAKAISAGPIAPSAISSSAAKAGCRWMPVVTGKLSSAERTNRVPPRKTPTNPNMTP